MSVYMTETEQLEEIKKWWLRHQRFITTSIFVVLLIVSGYRYWNWHVEKTTEQASTAYQNMMLASSKNDEEGIQSFANLLVKEYANTVYGSAAHLTLAKVFVGRGDYDKANSELAAVAHYSKLVALKQVATLRLARLLIAQKQYDNALKELTTIERSPYTPVVNELKGDIFVAMGEYPKAAESYSSALKEVTANGAANLYLEMKNNAVVSMIQSKREGIGASKTV